MTTAGVGFGEAFDAAALVQEHGPSTAQQRAEWEVEAQLRLRAAAEDALNGANRKLAKQQQFAEQTQAWVAQCEQALADCDTAVGRAQQQRDQLVAHLEEAAQ